MKTISVTNLVQVKVGEGTRGRFQTWADTKHVYVNITLDHVKKTPTRICLLLPWGAIYGRARKYKDAKDVGLDKSAKDCYEEADPNEVVGKQTKKTVTRREVKKDVS